MSEKVLEIKGFDELLKALQDAPQLARPLLEEAMTKSLSQLHDELAQYPSATEANQPGRFSLKTHQPMGYYERGRGWWYPVRTRQNIEMAGPLAGAFEGKSKAAYGKSRGVINASKSMLQAGVGVAGYKLSKQRSEVLSKKWTTSQVVNDTGVLGEIGTMVSYADYVQGNRQANFHAARKWETANAALERATPQIEKNFAEAVEKLIEQLKK